MSSELAHNLSIIAWTFMLGGCCCLCTTYRVPLLKPGPPVQVVPAAEKKDVAAAEGAALVEVGPRACLMPIRIFAGSFGGPVLYENLAYVSPNKASCTPDCAAYIRTQRCRPRSSEIRELHASCTGGDALAQACSYQAVHFS